MDAITKLSDGFDGQKSIIIPNQLVHQCKSTPIARQLYITDIGYYPQARHHYRQRSNGSDQHILIYCVEGKGWVEIESKRHPILPNHFCIIPKATGHKYGADKNDPWSIFWMHFDGTMVNEFFPVTNHQLITGRASYSDERNKLFWEVIETLDKNLSTSQIKYAGLLGLHLLGTFLIRQEKGAASNSDEDNLVERVIRFQQSQMHRMVSIDELVDLMNYSASHIFSLFKKKTGYPPIQYFNLMKVQKACELLNFTTMSIKQISLQLGFADPLYFSRLFRKQMGKSPQQYREAMIG